MNVFMMNNKTVFNWIKSDLEKITPTRQEIRDKVEEYYDKGTMGYNMMIKWIESEVVFNMQLECLK